MAGNQNSILNRSNHKRASYPGFMLVNETECWLIIFVANPELSKAAFGRVHFHWCKSVFHRAALSRTVCWLFLCPIQAWIVRVSLLALQAAQRPQLLTVELLRRRLAEASPSETQVRNAAVVRIL
jgi:hypothetical protein